MTLGKIKEVSILRPDGKTNYFMVGKKLLLDGKETDVKVSMINIDADSGNVLVNMSNGESLEFRGLPHIITWVN